MCFDLGFAVLGPVRVRGYRNLTVLSRVMLDMLAPVGV